MPPGPVKIGHKKDGHQRSHRFHVSRPPLPGRWIRYWENWDVDKISAHSSRPIGAERGGGAVAIFSPSLPCNSHKKMVTGV